MAPASFGPVQQIEAGPLAVGYVEVGPPNGQPVVLLHGWPYDIHSYAEAAPALGAASGRRAVLPLGEDGLHGAVVPRRQLDATLLAVARGRGVDVRENHDVEKV